MCQIMQSEILKYKALRLGNWILALNSTITFFIFYNMHI